jgi:hypothetical protein
MVAVVVDQMGEQFGLVLGDVASAEPQWSLFSQCGNKTSTCGAVVKHDVIVTAGGRVFKYGKKQMFFCTKLN